MSSPLGSEQVAGDEVAPQGAEGGQSHQQHGFALAREVEEAGAVEAGTDPALVFAASTPRGVAGWPVQELSAAGGRNGIARSRV
jgi:hypothetical protein